MELPLTFTPQITIDGVRAELRSREMGQGAEEYLRLLGLSVFAMVVAWLLAAFLSGPEPRDPGPVIAAVLTAVFLKATSGSMRAAVGSAVLLVLGLGAVRVSLGLDAIGWTHFLWAGVPAGVWLVGRLLWDALRAAISWSVQLTAHRLEVRQLVAGMEVQSWDIPVENARALVEDGCLVLGPVTIRSEHHADWELAWLAEQINHRAEAARAAPMNRKAAAHLQALVER